MNPLILGLTSVFRENVGNLIDACADNIRSWGRGMEGFLIEAGKGLGRRIGGPE